MNRTIIETALGAGLGALTLLKILREVDVSNKSWRPGADGVAQKRKWIKARDKLNTYELPKNLPHWNIHPASKSYLKNKKADEIYNRVKNQKIKPKSS